jgi:hypothetical protein
LEIKLFTGIAARVKPQRRAKKWAGGAAQGAK